MVRSSELAILRVRAKDYGRETNAARQAMTRRGLGSPVSVARFFVHLLSSLFNYILL